MDQALLAKLVSSVRRGDSDAVEKLMANSDEDMLEEINNLIHEFEYRIERNDNGKITLVSYKFQDILKHNACKKLDQYEESLICGGDEVLGDPEVIDKKYLDRYNRLKNISDEISEFQYWDHFIEVIYPNEIKKLDEIIRKISLGEKINLPAILTFPKMAINQEEDYLEKYRHVKNLLN